MSRLTWLTTTRLRNLFLRFWAIRPSTTASFLRVRASASTARGPGRRFGVGLLRLLALRIEHGLHAFLLAAFHHAAVLGQVQGDPFAGHHVVLAPHARVPDEQHSLLGVVVLGPLRR